MPVDDDAHTAKPPIVDDGPHDGSDAGAAIRAHGDGVATIWEFRTRRSVIWEIRTRRSVRARDVSGMLGRDRETAKGDIVRANARKPRFGGRNA